MYLLWLKFSLEYFCMVGKLYYMRLVFLETLLFDGGVDILFIFFMFLLILYVCRWKDKGLYSSITNLLFRFLHIFPNADRKALTETWWQTWTWWEVLWFMFWCRRGTFDHLNPLMFWLMLIYILLWKGVSGFYLIKGEISFQGMWWQNLVSINYERGFLGSKQGSQRWKLPLRH